MSRCKRSTKIEFFRARFLSEVSYILQPSNSQGKSFLNYLQRVGKQLKIRNLNPHELINNAVIRGLTYIGESSEEIRNTQAWLRRVCTFIMYDMVKSEKKTRLLKDKSKEPCPLTTDPFVEIELDENVQTVRSALSCLSKTDQEIIALRFYWGLSYKEIQHYYLEVAQLSIKIPTLRKRESRAVRRLREMLLSQDLCDNR
ncbi:sigma-70 family RNA polymerase sigma factor [Leptolyngbyaceae cyanobacterium CCMR0081]|uniref:Sigma-70 family RNA polymerase sigma factor n=1 Tax=Adonisia turfae CCMR0081 TaxID=2292702 RepID=A0A6M0RD20_9CYAN|nr:sigma-70 family RNA polymerase sigma factor [Adonisia turfae CCMR0081]